MIRRGFPYLEYRTEPASAATQQLEREGYTIVRGLFSPAEVWLTSVLTRGRDDGTLRFAGSPGETAQMIVSGLEGAMLVARCRRARARTW